MAEEIFEARPVRGFAGKDEAAIAFDPRHLRHRGLRILRIEVARIAVLQRHRLEPAIEMIGPAVIAALEFLGIALVVGDDERAAMGALIVDDADFAVGVAHQNHRLLADEGGKIIARIFHLAFMADIDPGGAENALELEFENGGIAIDAAMNARWLHQRSETFRGECLRRWHRQLPMSARTSSSVHMPQDVGNSYAPPQGGRSRACHLVP